MTKREQLIEWLGDAHAMEVGIISTLEKHISDAHPYPKLRSALSQHLRETKRHAVEMKKALSSLGGTHPIIKEGVSKVVNLLSGFTTSLSRDTVIKNGIADFATEHFEIACYTSLIETATELREPRIAATCKAILKEEKAMAKVLESQMKDLNTAYLRTLDPDPKEAPATLKAASQPTPKTSPSKAATQTAPAKSSLKASRTKKR